MLSCYNVFVLRGKKMPEIKLIATDIDGTILKCNYEFNPEVKDCIEKLTQEGVKTVLITGRMHSSTKRIADELKLDTPVISYQGGLIKHGDKTLYERYLPDDCANEVIKWAKKNKVHINLYMNDRLFVEEEDHVIKRYAKQGGIKYKIKSFDKLKIERVNKILVIDFEDENKVTVWKDYLAIKYPQLGIVKSTPHYCEVCHGEATKAHALNFLKGYWGLKQEEVLAIGDQNNDIDLLKAGGIKVAMGNATDELKAVADYVTDTVNHNGFVKAVEKFVYTKVNL